MEFGKHIEKGLWGFADKSLPALYGVGFIFFAVRVLPPIEYGNFVLVQSIFILTVSIAQTLALQPMVKFAAETDDVSGIFSMASLFYAGVLLVVSFVFIFFKDGISVLLHAEKVKDLMIYVPILLLASYVRNIIIYFLQSKLEIIKIFWIDAIHFLGSLCIVAIFSANNLLHSSETLFNINIATFTASSILSLFLLFSKWKIRPRFQMEVGRNFWHYGKYSFIASATYSLYTQLDSFVISAFTGPVNVAIYNAAKVLIRGYDIFMQAINMFIVPVVARMASQKKHNELLVLAEKSTFMFTAFVIPFIIILVVFASPIIHLMYGTKYLEAIPLLRILAISGLFIPGTAIASSYAYGLGKMKEIFFVSIGTTISYIVVLTASTYFFKLEGSAWANVFSFALMMSVWYKVIISRADIQLRWRNIFIRYEDGVNFFLKTFFPSKEK